MNNKVEIVSGVHCDNWMSDAGFERGSLEDLAEGVREALWRRRDLFEESDVLVVSVGGDRQEARDGPVEVKIWRSDQSSSRLSICHALEDELLAVREANMPDSEYAQWPCDCEEYCDQDHGEGAIDLYVQKPSFHEMAVVLGTRGTGQ